MYIFPTITNVRVTKFSRQHKTLLCRSAFTYCEDELPKGCGKEKYGGPFTTEQVEDVKAFYGILFSFGVEQIQHYQFLPVIYDITPEVYSNGTLYNSLTRDILITRGLLSPLLMSTFVFSVRLSHSMFQGCEEDGIGF